MVLFLDEGLFKLINVVFPLRSLLEEKVNELVPVNPAVVVLINVGEQVVDDSDFVLVHVLAFK